MTEEAPVEVGRTQGAESIRMRIRLKHPLAADEEIVTVLPHSLQELEEAFDRANVMELRLLLTSADEPIE